MGLMGVILLVFFDVEEFLQFSHHFLYVFNSKFLASQVKRFIIVLTKKEVMNVVFGEVDFVFV